MKEKIANLTIDIPYKRAGNIIHQEPVAFDFYREDDVFILVPSLNEEERRVANLPQELQFTIENGQPVSKRGKLDGNFHVIQDAFDQLKGKYSFSS